MSSRVSDSYPPITSFGTATPTGNQAQKDPSHQRLAAVFNEQEPERSQDRSGNRHLLANTAKLDTEAGKYRREACWRPVVWIAAFVGAALCRVKQYGYVLCSKSAENHSPRRALTV